MNWSDAKWSLADDDAQNEAKPAAGEGDTLVFTANSAMLGINENSAALTDLTMTGYANSLVFNSTYTIDVDGDAILAGNFMGTGTIQVAGDIETKIGTSIASTVTIEHNGAGAITPTLTTNGVTLGNFTVNNNPTSFTLLDNLALTGNLIYTAGKFTTTSRTVTHSGTATLAWNNYSQRLTSYALAAGATITRTAKSYCLALNVPATATLAASAGGNVMDVWPAGNDFLGVAGTVTTAGIEVHLEAGTRTNALGIADTVAMTVGGKDGSMTQSEALSVAALTVLAHGDNKYGKLALSGSGHSLGDVTLGDAGEILRLGHLDLAGANLKMDSLTEAGGGATTCELDTGEAYIELDAAGTMDLDNIVETNTSATVVGGTIDNADFSGSVALLHFFRDGAGTNTDVTAVDPLYEVFGGTGVYAGGLAA